ncbi:P-loop containing nucleoside triphosphate hydrolase protein [Gautieria morchelliformis]|nr:P-loop containing nucleoside triphosphate hydrolase protein [Gautieria morchelliformis]
MSSTRKLPIILITGTPGTGKSTTAELLVAQSAVPLQYINVGDWVKERHLHEGYDQEWETYLVDDDKVLDELEPQVKDGGVVLDWHTCDIFPESWIDLVIVLRCDHTTLWNRLQERNYPLRKIQENNESEIMQTVLDDARESYETDIIVELQSESTEDLEGNVQRILLWIDAWLKNNAESS